MGLSSHPTDCGHRILTLSGKLFSQSFEDFIKQEIDKCHEYNKTNRNITMISATFKASQNEALTAAKKVGFRVVAKTRSKYENGNPIYMLVYKMPVNKERKETDL